VLELPLDARGREEIVDRGRTYLLRSSDVETLREIGRFRTIAEDDLARFHYQGRESAMQYDLRSLAEQGLVARRRHAIRRGEGLAIVTLTEQGRRLLDSARESDAPTQRYYAGFVKPAEIAHDAAIYRMYQAEAEDIERAGGRVERIVLDYELKRRVYSPLAAARDASAEDYACLQEQVAQDNALEVVDGKIPLPDRRIEFERADGESAHVDLELATEHYRASQLAAKARAGFKLYGPAPSRAGAPVRDEREITAEILAL
jgi:DNA-binding MarR family transcriptional regulator